MSNLIHEGSLEREDHASDVLTLLDACSNDPFGNGHPLSEEVRGKVINGLIAHPTTHVFPAYRNGEAVGLAICFLGYSTFRAPRILKIKDYFILPSQRCRGIGRDLMTFVAGRARELDCCLLMQEVQENNHRARHVCAAAGFAQTVYVPEAGDSLYLHKEL